MKKNITMHKNTFIKGAFITTLGIVISKILGIVYVIPFHAVIGDEGGALYGYAYTVYSLFMSLASLGIPLSISKLVSEYQTLGYYNAKRRVFIIGKRIALIMGVVSFLIIFICAPFLVNMIFGDITGGSNTSDVVFVIRVIATAILIVPILSIYRGYFEGHRLFSPPSISQVIEQLIRVFIIIFGSFIALKVFKFNLASSVGIALFGATVGALFSYIYLLEKKLKNKSKFNEKIRQVNEPIITNKTILKKIVYYAIPFILIDIFKSVYNYIDMITVVKGLVSYASYKVSDAEVIYSMLSTWSAKFNMIVLSISTGVVVSLIPNLTESFVKKDKISINKKINQAFNILLFLIIPMTLGISFLAKPIWILFYGKSVYGPSVLSYYIFVGLFIALFTASITILQVFKDYKVIFISLIIGLILKIIFTNYLLISFYKMSLAPYYGVITASIIGYFTSFVICLIVLKFKYTISFEEVIKILFDVMCGSILMILVLFFVKLFIPIYSNIRIVNLLIIFLYVFIGILVYFIYGYYTKLIKRVFGNKMFNIIKK